MERLRGLVAGVSLHGVLLALILLTAFSVRALRCAEGLPYLHEWDEPQTASTALKIVRTGDFNPHFFNYGNLLIYLNAGVDAVHYLYLMTKPDTDPESLQDISQIRTNRDTGYHWTISHPSFFLWNRLLTALLGTGSVLIAYFIARELKGRWAGLLAAGLLAGVDVDIKHAALVTPNVPVAFFGALVVLLSLLYLRRGTTGYLLGSAAACGLAASTKYNGAVSMICPMAALAGTWWRGRPRLSGWMWVAVALVPILAFLAGTPYALLDLPTFLEDVGYEIRHYRVIGHRGETIEPGLPHALHQSRRVTQEIGVLPAAFALLGLGVSLTTASGRLAFVYPIAYLVLMSGTRVSFHRNFLVLYPFASVAFGCGVVAAAEYLRTARPGAVIFRRARVALFVVAALSCLVMSVRGLSASYRLATTPEMRSVVIDQINDAGAKAGADPLVGIARELEIHRIDLARLEVRYEVAPFLDLVCADRRRYALLVTAKEMHGALPEEEVTADLMNSLARAWTPSVTKAGGSRWTHLTYLNWDPGMLILSREEGRGESPRCSAPLDLQWNDPAGGRTSGVKVTLNDEITVARTSWMTMPPGRHAFIWFANGPSKGGYLPQLMGTLKIRFGGIEAIREQTVFEPSRMEQPYAFMFEAPSGAEFSVEFGQSEAAEVTVWSLRLLDLPPGS